MNKQPPPRILLCALESYRNVIKSILNNYYTFYSEFYYTHTHSNNTFTNLHPRGDTAHAREGPANASSCRHLRQGSEMND